MARFHAPAFVLCAVSVATRALGVHAIRAVLRWVGPAALFAAPAVSAQTVVPFLQVKIVAPWNALVTEGHAARHPAATLFLDGLTMSAMEQTGEWTPEPPPEITPPPSDLYAGVTAGSYSMFSGQTAPLNPSVHAGDFLLGAAKDSTFSIHARLKLLGDTGVLAPESVSILVNSRERTRLDLMTTPDGPSWQLFYGTQEMPLPAGVRVDFPYGGWIMRPTLQSLVGSSGSGVRFEITTQYFDTETLTVIPEPSKYAAMAGFGALLAAGWRRRRQRRRSDFARV